MSKAYKLCRKINRNIQKKMGYKIYKCVFKVTHIT